MTVFITFVLAFLAIPLALVLLVRFCKRPLAGFIEPLRIELLAGLRADCRVSQSLKILAENPESFTGRP